MRGVDGTESGRASSPVRELLASLAGEDVRYFPNPGNAGDALIALGAYRALAAAGIPIRVGTPGDPARGGQVLMYGGGGNLVDYYSDCRDFLLRYHDGPARLVVLPQTVTGNEDLLAQLGSNVTLICRELRSYEHVRRHGRGCEVLLDHDLALDLDPGEVMGWRAGVGLRPDPAHRPWTAPIRLWARDRRNRADVIRQIPGSRQPLDAFRGDLEATVTPPPGNVDLSRRVNLPGTHHPGVAALISRSLLRCVEATSGLRTNRLHVAIAGGLLGKPVEFHPNTYFKNEAIFEFSLRDRFPTVRWMGGETSTPEA